MSVLERDKVLDKLRQHEQELREEGILRLSLFGSVARGQSIPGSDVDLLAEFDSSRRYSILDRVRVQNRLASIIGTPVDLAPAKSLLEGIRERISQESIRAF